MTGGDDRESDKRPAAPGSSVDLYCREILLLKTEEDSEPHDCGNVNELEERSPGNHQGIRAYFPGGEGIPGSESDVEHIFTWQDFAQPSEVAELENEYFPPRIHFEDQHATAPVPYRTHEVQRPTSQQTLDGSQPELCMHDPRPLTRDDKGKGPLLPWASDIDSSHFGDFAPTYNCDLPGRLDRYACVIPANSDPTTYQGQRRYSGPFDELYEVQVPRIPPEDQAGPSEIRDIVCPSADPLADVPQSLTDSEFSLSCDESVDGSHSVGLSILAQWHSQDAADALLPEFVEAANSLALENYDALQESFHFAIQDRVTMGGLFSPEGQFADDPAGRTEMEELQDFLVSDSSDAEPDRETVTSSDSFPEVQDLLGRQSGLQPLPFEEVGSLAIERYVPEDQAWEGFNLTAEAQPQVVLDLNALDWWNGQHPANCSTCNTPNQLEGDLDEETLPVMQYQALLWPEHFRNNFDNVQAEKAGNLSPLLVEKAANLSPLPVEMAANLSPLPVEKAANLSPLPVEKAANLSPLPVEKAANLSPLPVEKAANLSPLPVEKAANLSLLPAAKAANPSLLSVEKAANLSPLPVEKAVWLLPAAKAAILSPLPAESSAAKKDYSSPLVDDDGFKGPSLPVMPHSKGVKIESLRDGHGTGRHSSPRARKESPNASKRRTPSASKRRQLFSSSDEPANSSQVGKPTEAPACPETPLPKTTKERTLKGSASKAPSSPDGKTREEPTTATGGDESTTKCVQRANSMLLVQPFSFIKPSEALGQTTLECINRRIRSAAERDTKPPKSLPPLSRDGLRYDAWSFSTATGGKSKSPGTMNVFRRRLSFPE